MKLYVPEIGDELTIEQDWHFDLHYEERNASLYAHLGFTDVALKLGSYSWNTKDPLPTSVALPAGTILKVERIYIRKGQDDFNSMTFVVPGIKVAVPFPHREYPKVNGKPDYSAKIIETVQTKNRPLRFWVKLEDANKIEFTKP